MDEKSYSTPVINRFLNTQLFFKDALLKKYYEQNDMKKFRSRVHRQFPKEDFEKLIYVLITDSIRDIILDTVGELTVFMKSMGDLIISGGEAFNMYADYKDRVITSDIDAKFIPGMKNDKQYFGKLQSIKLIMWNKLGEIAKRLNTRIKTRILSRKNKIFRFIGIGFKKQGPYVTRRYTLIKKKKTGKTNAPSIGDVFIDVELFALDLNMRYYCISSGKIEDFTLGGILDIPYMRPGQFGASVVKTPTKKGVTYRNMATDAVKTNKNIMVASKEFLIEDIYLMHKLKLRPEKKEKDRQRLLKLAKMFTKNVKASETIDSIFKKVHKKITKSVIKTPIAKKKNTRPKAIVNRGLRVNPYKYNTFTTTPSNQRLSKQIVHGINVVKPGQNTSGFEKTGGNQRFNMDTHLWKKNNSTDYIKNEFNMRPIVAKPLKNNTVTTSITETLYGFKPRRDGWVPKPLLNRAAQIPFVGLKI
jgi:hypothetical protein